MTQSRREGQLVLVDHRAALDADVPTWARTGCDTPHPGDRNDREQVDENRRDERSFALRRMRSEARVAIDAALMRLEAGRYGVCVACERPIPNQRLWAVPLAVRCQSCADEREPRPGVDSPGLSRAARRSAATG